jgi:hypothetical protein
MFIQFTGRSYRTNGITVNYPMIFFAGFISENVLSIDDFIEKTSV